MTGRCLSVLAVTVCGLLASATGIASDNAEKVIILGVDGMDPVMLRDLMDHGQAPNLAKLALMGDFMPLGTSVPPQSPVAWSNFSTGMDSGGHGIFDFLGLDRRTLKPFQSTARVLKPAIGPLDVGSLRIPLAPERTVALRAGTVFWEILESQGVHTTMFRIPANYPPLDTGGYAISGMGTPDLLGTSGTFSYFTDDPSVEPGDVSGGVIERVRIDDGFALIELSGPTNAFDVDSSKTKASLEVFVDPEHPVVLVRSGEQDVLLNEGDWSDWIQVHFEMMSGLVSIPGMIRVYLQQISPHFSLYVSPVNIDPRDAAQPISTPENYAAELAAEAGPFYTQEMPEDTKALSAHVLSPQDFLMQSNLVLEERKRLIRFELQRFTEIPRPKLLFFYFSSVDQRNHMFARHADPTHPFHDPDAPEDLAMAMQRTYEEIDTIVGWVLEELDDSTLLIVMSDHGFASFRRQVNLNSWLERQGYLTLLDTDRRDSVEWLEGINWSKTRAFAIGLNSLYLNVRGRERYGLVDPGERRDLALEIAGKLMEWKDGPDGDSVVTQPVLREEVYSGPYVEDAPDIIVGYARGYRVSWATTSGKVPVSLIEDNIHEWSGDHLMDSRTVPGVLLTNRPVLVKSADLKDLPVSLLANFGIVAPEQMKGRSIF